MINNFEYYQPTKLYFGAGRINECSEVVKEFGRNVLLVTGKSNKPFIKKIVELLEKSEIKVSHFNGALPNPTTDCIADGAEMAVKEKADVIVGLGGGSAMDVAKAIAVEATHEGSAWDYLFYKKVPTEKTLPVIAIPTTAGTGSHVTQVSVLTNSKENDKSAIFNPVIFPKAAIVDPELTLSVPGFVTASTGFDVFAHSFEALIHVNTNPFVKMIAKEAIRIVVRNIKNAVDSGDNLKTRAEMAWADTLAGISIANAGVTLPHGIGMAIGGLYPHVPHGQALAVVYPAFAEFTYETAVEDFAFLYRTLTDNLYSVTDKEAALFVGKELRKFLKNIKFSCRLRDLKIPEQDLNKLAEQSMVLPDYRNNPKIANLEDIKSILENSY